MDDYLAGSDLCEENQFLRQARLLRAMAGAGGKVYFLAERGAEYNDNYDYIPDEDGQIRTLFLDRADAEVAAAFRNAQKFREIDLEDFGYDTGDYTSLDEATLNAHATAILGEPFRLWAAGDEPRRVKLPARATDDQMIAVAALFDKLRFFHVLEAEFGPGPMPRTDQP